MLLLRRCLLEESPRTDEALRHSAVTRVKLNPDKDERGKAENRQTGSSPRYKINTLVLVYLWSLVFCKEVKRGG